MLTGSLHEGLGLVLTFVMVAADVRCQLNGLDVCALCLFLYVRVDAEQPLSSVFVSCWYNVKI